MVDASIGDLYPELATSLKVTSEALREERKMRRFMKYEKPSIFKNLNITEGCKIGRRNSEYMEMQFRSPTRDYGRISKQSLEGKSEVQAGFRAVQSEFEKVHYPSHPAEKKSPNTVSIQNQRRAIEARSRVQGFAIEVNIKKKR